MDGIDGIKRTAKELFLQASRLPGDAQRQAFLHRACGSDMELGRRVEQLLAADADSQTNPLDRVGAMLDSANWPERLLDNAQRQVTVDIPPRIGPYQPLEQIGEGGMGVVYVAEQREPIRRKVALKIIKPGMDSRQVVARFEAERQALAIMNHPHIAKVLDAGTTDTGRPYFVMELVHGVPITEFCDARGLDLRQRLELFVQVCNAVQHAHQKGVIHRDLKPSNILVERDDDRAVPKVIDFGVAKAVHQPLTAGTLYTGFLQMIGTPLYMSPEQAQLDSQDVDTRSDVYSLGVVLYELLTGSTPFDRETFRRVGVEEMRRIICEEDPPRPSSRISTMANQAASTVSNRRNDLRKRSLAMRRELDWVVLKAIDRDRSRRYQSASGLAADVQRFLDGEPVEACPSISSYHLARYAGRKCLRWTRRHPVTAALSATLLVAALGIVASFAAHAIGRSTYAAALEASLSREILQSREADRQRRLAEARERETREQAYVSNIMLAARMWSGGQQNRMRQAMEPLLPQLTDSERQSFAWRYLWTLSGNVADFTSQSTDKHGLAFTDDGEYLATISKRTYDPLILVSHARSHRTFRALKPASPPLALVFSGDSNLIVAEQDGHIATWNWRNGSKLHVDFLPELHIRDPLDGSGQVAFASDGSQLAFQVNNGQVLGPIMIWSTHDKRALPLMSDVLTQALGAAAFTPDGSLLVVSLYASSTRPTVKIFSTASCEHVADLPSTGTWFQDLEFSPDGRLLVGGSSYAPGHVAVWDFERRQLLRTIPAGGTKSIVCVSISPDGRLVASGRLDDISQAPAESLQLADLEQGHIVSELPTARERAVSVKFSPDGQRLAFNGLNGLLRLWSIRQHPAFETFPAHAAEAWCVAFSPDDRLLVTGGDDHAVQLWNADRVQPHRRLNGHQSLVSAAVFTPDGTALATADFGGVIQLWERSSLRARHSLMAHDGPIRHLAFRSDGRLLVSAGDDRLVKLWDVDSGQLLATLPGHVNKVRAAVFFATDRLATADNSGFIHLWDSDGRLLRRWQAAEQIQSLAVTPNEKLLVAGSREGAILLFHLPTGTLADSLSTEPYSARAIAVSPDGRTLASGGEDAAVTLWDLPSRRQLMPMQGVTAQVNGLAFSSDGQKLVAVLHDGTLKCWTAERADGIASDRSTADVSSQTEKPSRKNISVSTAKNSTEFVTP